MTWRGVLSAASSVFDPLAFLAPFILTAKQILQDLCRLRLEWDEEIPLQYTPRWENWLLDLPKLLSFSISRCLMPAEFGQVASSQLHYFSDASEYGYGFVSYVRLVNEEGNVHCALLFGKSCITPLKALTIPCRELSDATKSVCHDRMLRREIEIPLSMWSMFWSDSISLLCYIKNETFFANHNFYDLRRFDSKPRVVHWRNSQPWRFCVKTDDSWGTIEQQPVVNGAGISMGAWRRMASESLFREYSTQSSLSKSRHQGFPGFND